MVIRGKEYNVEAGVSMIGRSIGLTRTNNGRIFDKQKLTHALSHLIKKPLGELKESELLKIEGFVPYKTSAFFVKGSIVKFEGKPQIFLTLFPARRLFGK